MRSQTDEQAAAGRMSPFHTVQFGRDMLETRRNGSDQARRRARILGWVMFVAMMLPAVAILLSNAVS